MLKLDKFLKVEIVSPEKIVLNTDAESVTAPGVKGEFQVLVNHAPLVSSLGIGRLKVIDDKKKEFLYSTSGGMLEVKNNKVSILAETIESPLEIDKKRARESLERGEKRIRDAKMDKDRAFIAIERAKNRLKIASLIK